MNWMELCHPRDGSGVVYAVGKPIKPQEKTRVSWTESSAGRRARASLERTRNENLDSCAEIKSDMGISGELYGYAVMIEARYASRWGSQLCTAVSSLGFGNPRTDYFSEKPHNFQKNTRTERKSRKP